MSPKRWSSTGARPAKPPASAGRRRRRPSRACPADHPALDLLALRRGDQLAQTARTSACVRRSQGGWGRLPGRASGVPPQHRVVGEPLEELEWSASSGSVASSCSSASSECDRSSMRPSACCHAQARAAVLDREQADEDAPVEPPSGVASPHRGVTQRRGRGGGGSPRPRRQHYGRQRSARGRSAQSGSWKSRTDRLGFDPADRDRRDRGLGAACHPRPSGRRVLGSRCEGAGLSLLGGAAALRAQIDVGARSTPAGSTCDSLVSGRSAIALGPVETAYSPASATARHPIRGGLLVGGAAGASRSSRSSANRWSCGRRSTASIRAEVRSTCSSSAGSTLP